MTTSSNTNTTATPLTLSQQNDARLISVDLETSRNAKLNTYTAIKPATRVFAAVSRKLAVANLKSSLPKRRGVTSTRRKPRVNTLRIQRRSQRFAPTKYRRSTQRHYIATVTPADGRLHYLRRYRRGAPRLKMTRVRRGLARQAARKIRAVSSVKHSALRRRLARFHWRKKLYLQRFPYQRRRRLVRRLARRGTRYLRATLAVFAGANQRQRLAYSKTNYARLRKYKYLAGLNAALLTCQPSSALLRRQQLFARLHSRKSRRLGGIIGLGARLATSYYRPKSRRSWSRTHLTRTRLAARRVAHPMHTSYRTTLLSQRQTLQNTSKWLFVKRTRKARAAFMAVKYLCLPFIGLKKHAALTRMRMRARHQQRFALSSTAGSLAHPQPFAARYRDIQRRLDIKGLLNRETLAPLFAQPRLKIKLASTNELSFFQLAPSPASSPRSQLPGVARNAGLRLRAAAQLFRSQATPASGVSDKGEATRGKHSLLVQKTARVARRVYSRRPEFRLPRVTVKRKEVRRNSDKLFARHTLKQPTTLAGKRALLLPVTSAHKLHMTPVMSSPKVTPADFRTTRQLDARNPRVWRRGPGYREARKILDMRITKRTKRARRSNRARTLRLTTKRALLARMHDRSTEQHASIPLAVGLDALSIKLRAYNQRAAACAWASRGRKAKRLTPAGSRGGVKRYRLQLTNRSSREKKHGALRHLQSVQHMLDAERRLLAWSPVYPTHWRRRSSPRLEGSLRPRRWPSQKMLRHRRSVNNGLLRRGLPKRRYFDHAYGHLQFHRGSAATVGYERFRRAQRPRSKNNRWWKPVTAAAPFSNPYSRRSVNAKKHIVRHLARQASSRVGDQTVYAQHLAGQKYPLAFPPRVISSRKVATGIFRRKRETLYAFKLREKKTRRKMPPTLRRWTVNARKFFILTPGALRKPTTLGRTRRSVRKLEKLYPRSNVWANHRWQSLDSRNSAVSAAALYSQVCARLPIRFWQRFHGAVTPTATLAARKAVFAKFRAWHQALPVNTLIESGKNSLLLAATKFVVSTVITRRTTATELSLTQYQRLVTQKRDRFWQLRELPKLTKKLRRTSTVVTDKNNSPLYKRWLRGAERYLRFSQDSQLPPKYAQGSASTATRYGKARRRFPASGRRRQSYEASLHAFARRTAPSRFRRVTTLRVIRPRVSANRDYKVNLQVQELTRATRRQRLMTQKLNRIAYLSPAWKELLTYRGVSAQASAAPLNKAYPTAYAQPQATFTKRRFASLPVKHLYKKLLRAEQARRPRQVRLMRVQRAGLLRTALRRRRMERRFIDLKKHILRRRLPKDQSTPPWRRRKLARKHAQHLRYGDWSPRHFDASMYASVLWTMHDLEDRVPRRRDRVTKVVSSVPSSEVVAVARTAPRRLSWARNGFQISWKHSVRRRGGRKVVKRRRRGPSPIAKGGRVHFRHISERKSLRRAKNMSKFRNNRVEHLFARSSARFSAVKNQLASTLVIRASGTTARVNAFHGQRYSSRVSASGLLRFSAACYRTQRARLIARLRSKKSKFARRAFAALQRITARNLIDAARAKGGVRAYTENLGVYSPVAPLTFQNPTTTVVKSAAEKRRDVVWNIQNKERRYKRTAQYAESLARFIPALISKMLAQKNATTPIHFSLAKSLIASTYWNLRVYLNVDPFANRLALRDKNASFLRALSDNIAVLSENQVTEHANRTSLRSRFQSCRIHPAPTSDRFRLDWLRAFFPRKHALFQEDPEEHSRLPLSTRNVKRIIPSGYGIAKSRTGFSGLNLERRARQLLRLRLSSCSARFETLLRTNRRIPESELDSVLPSGGSSVPRFAPIVVPPQKTFGHTKSFFSRGFVTSTTRATAALSRFIARRSRLAGATKSPSTTFTAVAARYRLKPRVDARGRSNFTGYARSWVDAGSLDPRFLRYKSPRSRQYLLRLPQTIAQLPPEEKLEKLRLYTELREQRTAGASSSAHAAYRRIRLNRRYFYRGLPSNEVHALTKIRSSVPSRRVPTLLRSQAVVTAPQLVATEYATFPNRHQQAFTSSRVYAERKKQKQLRYVNTRGPSSTHQIAILNNRYNKAFAATERSILHYRAAKKRAVTRVYQPGRVVRYAGLCVNRRLVRASRAAKKAKALLQRAHVSAAKLSALLKSSASTQAEHYQLLLQRTQNAINHLGARVDQLARVRTPNKGLYSTHGLHRAAKARLFTRACIRLQRKNKRTVFDTFRAKLWHKLTHRWMKKERFMRNWFRETKRWFRNPWLSRHVDVTRPKARNLLPGEVRSREQQDGERVFKSDYRGLTKKQGRELKKGARPAVLAAKKKVRTDWRKASRLLSRAKASGQKKLISLRLHVSAEATRTARPTMWLANLQAARKMAEITEWRTKTRKEKDAVRLALKEAAIERKKAGLRPLPRRKAPLKMPADHWMPPVIWKDIQRRARRLEWRESDDVFTRRGFKNAFRFYQTERNRAPWLESLMYNRSLFSTRLREFRRRQFPKEQKKYKWLQRVRKSLFPGRTNVYIKGRRWPRLRIYNQHLHYTLFNFPNRSAARRHFKKLNRRSRKVGFVDSQSGLSNRLDNVLIHLNMAPTIFWARTVAPLGLLRVNGTVVSDCDYLFKAGDFIEPVWSKVLRFRHFFTCPLGRNEEPFRHRRFSVTGISKNLHYHPGIRCFTFLGNPREGDLRKSSRLQPHLFRWFRLDSVATWV